MKNEGYRDMKALVLMLAIFLSGCASQDIKEEPANWITDDKQVIGFQIGDRFYEMPESTCGILL